MPTVASIHSETPRRRWATPPGRARGSHGRSCSAAAISASAVWPGRDMADSIVAWTGAKQDAPGGWVLDRHGDVHAWGSAPALEPSQTWPAWDIARGLAGAGSGGGSTERVVLDPQ